MAAAPDALPSGWRSVREVEMLRSVMFPGCSGTFCNVGVEIDVDLSSNHTPPPTMAIASTVDTTMSVCVRMLSTALSLA
jgi:hypothetical protein